MKKFLFSLILLVTVGCASAPQKFKGNCHKGTTIEKDGTKVNWEFCTQDKK